VHLLLQQPHPTCRSLCKQANVLFGSFPTKQLMLCVVSSFLVIHLEVVASPAKKTLSPKGCARAS
jgi:hypothetical protein